MKLVSKGCFIMFMYKLRVNSNPRKTNISTTTGIVKMYLGSVEKIFHSTKVLLLINEL